MSDFPENLLTFSLTRFYNFYPRKNTKYPGNNSHKNVEDHQVLSFDLLLSSLLYHFQKIKRKKTVLLWQSWRWQVFWFRTPSKLHLKSSTLIDRLLQLQPPNLAPGASGVEMKLNNVCLFLKKGYWWGPKSFPIGSKFTNSNIYIIKFP